MLKSLKKWFWDEPKELFTINLDPPKPHRRGVKVLRYDDGAVWTIDYRPCKVSDKTTRPTYAGWYADGSKKFEWWESRGYHHRLDGPASIDYYENGHVNMESWYRDNKKHCSTGPSFTKYRDDGHIVYQEWWIDGEEMPYEEWFLQSDAPLHEKVEMKLKR